MKKCKNCGEEMDTVITGETAGLEDCPTCIAIMGRIYDKYNTKAEEPTMSNKLMLENKDNYEFLRLESGIDSYYLWLHNNEVDCCDHELRITLPPIEKVDHDPDCHIFATTYNNMPTDGICTCGFGLEWARNHNGDAVNMFSENRKGANDE